MEQQKIIATNELGEYSEWEPWEVIENFLLDHIGVEDRLCGHAVRLPDVMEEHYNRIPDINRRATLPRVVQCSHAILCLDCLEEELARIKFMRTRPAELDWKPEEGQS